MPKRRRASADEPLGVLFVDKPAGPTSAEVCDFIRWVLRTRSVGHCGTLDPDATGLLVCCVGPATKLVSLLTDHDKAYRGRFVLGTSTTTDDAAGDVLEQAPVSDEVWARAPEAVLGLLGGHELSPPAFSAVRIDGERAHAKARRGEVVDVPARTMVVHAVEDVAPVERGVIDATLRVSKGSFIRSFAVELGRRLGVPAHLGGLHRVASGRCALEHPNTVAGFDVTPMDPRPDGKPRHRIRLQGIDDERDVQAQALRARLIAPAEVLGMPAYDVPQDAQGADIIRRLGHGQPVPADHPGLAGLEPEGSAVLRSGSGVVLCRFSDEGGHRILRIQRTLRPLASHSVTGS